ncbi:ATP-binding cassette domain-containing protein [Ferrimicrobium sp.]|uniref:ATP-binding cassette domain-containing protein n=1 Tax=Ferrimicrobium sp. TaxID=2926050 RepID=UPI0026223AAB|nr:ATP-binding cassette domain-containing protein [Ferrimicrobium sp.]
MTLAIEVRNLRKTFKGGVTALEDVSFQVEAGTVFGLLGPNGAGKTTIVRILTTIIPPDNGQATIMGIDVTKSPQQVREHLGLAGQAAAVDERLTGEENLFMISRLNHLPKQVARDRSAELLHDFGLEYAAKRVLSTYSGGMRRRLDLAAALVAQPPVLFLDEPTTGLDPKSRNDLWEIIEKLLVNGTTVLLTTQYLEEADRLASRIAVVDHGLVIAEGTPDQLKANFGATVLELSFKDEEVTDKAKAAVNPLASAAVQQVENRLEIPVADGAATTALVLERLLNEKINPTRINLREPSLDDVFLALTEQPATMEG